MKIKYLLLLSLILFSFSFISCDYVLEDEERIAELELELELLQDDYDALQDKYNELEKTYDFIIENPDELEDTSESSDLVWISETGDCYHSNPYCGNINSENAYQIDFKEALDIGYTMCTNCY